eukprot:26436_4
MIIPSCLPWKRQECTYSATKTQRNPFSAQDISAVSQSSRSRLFFWTKSRIQKTQRRSLLFLSRQSRSVTQKSFWQTLAYS